MQGLILLDKPKDITSFGAVAKIKRTASEKRVGHTGTLDPMATGVLPVLLGRATALSSLLLDADKRYTAKVKLGVTTDTEDITGNIISENKVDVTNEQLNIALCAFRGKIMQKPPMYSAVKKNGVRLYKLAREGKTAEVEPREIEIFFIDLISPLDCDNVFEIDVHVSKGTYIRSLARDIGEFLGCGACLTELKRTYTGGFSLEACVPLDRLNKENISEYIISEEMAVAYLREVSVTEKQAVRFCNGGQLDLDRLKIKDLTDGELVRVKLNDKFLGVGIAGLEKNQLAIKCIINYPKEGSL